MKRWSPPGRSPGPYTVTEIREALRLAAERRGVGLAPLVVECRGAGLFGETRPPGIYYEDPVRRIGPTIVFEGAEPPAELLARFAPRDGSPGPLLVILGPDHIDPPLEEPQPPEGS